MLLSVKNLLNEILRDEEVLHLAKSNAVQLKEFLSIIHSDENFVFIDYIENEIIVERGKIVNGVLLSDNIFNYSFVPLGYILSGEVIVQKGGKATKKLTKGDFIGLFETSDWILTDQKREIGDWTLVANSDVKILYFSKNCFNHDKSAGFENYLVNICREDTVPQPITNMPLLDWVASHTTKSRLSEFIIVVHTHLLPNSFSFFRHLASLVDFGKIFILEKPYSTVDKTYKDLVKSGCEMVQVKIDAGMPYEFAVKKSTDILWSKIIEERKNGEFKKLLIIDDGGDLWTSIPWDSLNGVPIAGVEQTQRGITRVENHIKIPPIVSVASSGIKKLVESQFIGSSVVDKLQEKAVLIEKKRVGILGMGSIGQAAAKSLNALGFKVKFYDPNVQKNALGLASSCPSMDDLLNSSDIIIGTTGKDSLKGIAFDRVFGNKILASVSSSDIEFASLLKLAKPIENAFETREVLLHDNLVFEILNGGYPLNFDREKNATADEDIVLTWCLMYIGAMQAVDLIRDGEVEGKIYDLDKISQIKTLEKWIENKKNIDHNFDFVKLDEIEEIVDYKIVDKSTLAVSVWHN